MALDEAQQAAVKHFGGPALVLAGPGSGKTTVMTHRIWRLIVQHKIPPEQILVITFTKLAAMQMKERFLTLTADDAAYGWEHVTFGTFHAVFFMILKTVYRYSAEDIIHSRSQHDFIKMQLVSEKITVQDEAALVEHILAEIAKVKAAQCRLDSYEASSCDSDIFRVIFGRYQNMLKQERKLDFEDMMLHTLDLLKKQPAVLQTWQNQYAYVLIDEFQDIAPIQFDIIRMLVQKHHNLFVVGDDDQSIYGFRGSKPDIMIRFTDYYPDAAIYHMDLNYRSSGQIVCCAKQLINHNHTRFYKDLRTHNPIGEELRIMEFEHTMQECDFVASDISKRMDLSKGGERIAVLTRMNQESSYLVQYLSQKGFKVHAGGKKKSLSDHWIAKDIFSYIRLALGGRERADFLRIINKPSRRIGRRYFADSPVNLAQLRKYMTEEGQIRLAEQIGALADDLKMLGTLTPFAGINYLRKRVGYEDYVRQYAKEHQVSQKQLLEKLDAVHKSTKSCQTYEQWLAAFENDDESNREKDSAEGVNQHEIRFYTMHGAKGLEFDTVYILNANEGIMPYARALQESEIEEERRLFYVAMTRAKKHLVICYVRQQGNKAVRPSRFIKEIH